VFNYWLVPFYYVDNGVGLVFSYCIGYYDNQINKLNMVNWLNGEMGLNTQSLSLTL
jgi:hypothetical protein